MRRQLAQSRESKEVSGERGPGAGGEGRPRSRGRSVQGRCPTGLELTGEVGWGPTGGPEGQAGMSRSRQPVGPSEQLCQPPPGAPGSPDASDRLAHPLASLAITTVSALQRPHRTVKARHLTAREGPGDTGGTCSSHASTPTVQILDTGRLARVARASRAAHRWHLGA